LVNSATATNREFNITNYLSPTSGWTGKAWMSNASERFAFDDSNLVVFSEMTGFRDTYIVTNYPTGLDTVVTTNVIIGTTNKVVSTNNFEIINITDWMAHALPYISSTNYSLMTNAMAWWIGTTNRIVYQGVGLGTNWHMTNVAYGATRAIIDLTNSITTNIVTKTETNESGEVAVTTNKTIKLEIGADTPIFQMRDVWGRDVFYACKERSSTNDIEFEYDNEDDFEAPLVYFYKRERDNLVRVKAWIANSMDRCAWVDVPRWTNGMASGGIPWIDPTNGFPANQNYALSVSSLLTRANLPTNYLEWTPYSQFNGVGTPSTNEYTYGAFTTLDYGYWGISNIFKQLVWVFQPSTVAATNYLGFGRNETNDVSTAIADARAMFATNAQSGYGNAYWALQNFTPGSATNRWDVNVESYGEWRYTLNKFKPNGVVDLYAVTKGVGNGEGDFPANFDAQDITGVTYSPTNLYLLVGGVPTFDGYNGVVTNVYGNNDEPPNLPTATPEIFNYKGFIHSTMLLILKFDNTNGFIYR
jgi:hypothetical protein